MGSAGAVLALSPSHTNRVRHRREDRMGTEKLFVYQNRVLKVPSNSGFLAM